MPRFFKSLFWTLVLSLLIVVPFLVIFTKISPNLHYIAMRVGNTPDTNYIVIDIPNREFEFKTWNPNSGLDDVKAAAFSRDSTMFAAAYFYESGAQYTWIGVWNVEGDFLYSKTKAGWTTDLSEVFNN